MRVHVNLPILGRINDEPGVYIGIRSTDRSLDSLAAVNASAVIISASASFRTSLCSFVPASIMPSLRLGNTVPDFVADSTDGVIKFHEWIGDSWVRVLVADLTL